MLIVFGTTRPCCDREKKRQRDKKTYGEKERKEARAECHERMEKGQESQRELDSCGDTYVMYVCMCTYGMVPRCVIECFIHKRRTKPACLS